MALQKFDHLTEELLKDMAWGMTGTPITQQQFIDKVIEFDNSRVGTRPITFTSVTEPKTKANMPYEILFKVGQTNGILGFNYQDNVNAQREREGLDPDFLVQPSKTIREWLSFSIGITHKGLVVLRYRPTNPAPSYWVVKDVDNNLREIEKEEAVSYLPPVSEPTNQGVEKKIVYRTYGIDKIMGITFLGAENIISDADPTRLQVMEIVRGKLRS